MPAIRKIKAKRIAADIRLRLTDFELMAKYELTLDDLDQVMRILVEAGALRRPEVRERTTFFDDPANRSQTRRFPRTQLRVPLQIQDVSDSYNAGLIIDLSLGGFRARFIRRTAGDESLFLIHSDGALEPSTIFLRATCVWAREDLQEAGFKLLFPTAANLAKIQRLIDFFGFPDAGFSRNL
ncbi:MAG TPA: PilZ domain-containing protein [Desulfomonilaceae bacterium]|nr:PilZ domain-containing protein [Desulfomonilaceae bacterium]